MYNTEVGYCQGMSQIAALLLMYMNEEVNHCRRQLVLTFFIVLYGGKNDFCLAGRILGSVSLNEQSETCHAW